MVLYERRASMDARDFSGSSQRPPPFAQAPGPSFLRPAFPQDDVLRPTPRHHQPPPPRANQDTAVAADNLLSLIQSSRPRGSYEQLPRGREESGSTSEDQTPPLGRTIRKWRGLEEEHSSSPVIKKKRPGRPAKTVKDEDLQDGDQPKRKRRDKKPTYIVRKEKKAMLKAELVQLKQQVLQLRRASGIPDSFFMEKERLFTKAQENDRLRAESRKQDMLLRNAHAILSAEYLMKRSESPIETFIHLTGDLKQRRAALVNIREMKLKQADDFITERSKFLPQITHWCQENKFESEEGHFYAEKMDNTPFHGARSVRQVFEALQFFFRNMEISISEMLGDITVREDDDSTASNSFSNHRLVSTMAHGVKVEKNIVKFFQLVEPDVDDERSASYALVSTDSVDLDDLYPYVPDERIRMDINAAMKFTEHFCKKPPNRKRKARTRHLLYGNGGFPYQQDPEEEEEEEDDELERVVVLTRFFRVKLHHTEMDIPPHVLQEIRQGLACFSDTMVRSMHRVIFESR